MNKPLVISIVLIVVILNIYASGNSHKQRQALAAKATATEPVGAHSEVGHSDDEAAHTEGVGESHDIAQQAAAHTLGEAAHTEQQEDHTLPEAVHEAAGHTHGDQMSGDHGVPAGAAVVVNPIAATDESIRSGAAIFSQSCAACHGATGEGDGPGAAGLDPKPADLHADHVQGNSDGAMFWIISHGREGTAMPPWNTILSEEQRWDLVNFLRTFGEE